MRLAHRSADPPRRLVVGVAVLSPRGEQQGAAAVAHQLRQPVDALRLGVGHPPVRYAEVGGVDVVPEPVEGAPTLLPTSYAELGRRVRRGPRVAALAVGDHHDLDHRTLRVGGRRGDQPSRSEGLVVGVCREDHQPGGGRAGAVEQPGVAQVSPPRVVPPPVGGRAGPVVAELGRRGDRLTGHQSAPASTRAAPSAARSRSAWCWRR